MLRLGAPGAPPWDIAIAAPNWWRTPNPKAIAFISDSTGFVVDVPARRVLVEVPGAVRIRQDAHHDLILLLTQSEMTAVGPDGVAWQSGRLASADLKVVSIDQDRIVCTGYDGGEFPVEIIVDPATGKAGPLE